MTVYGASRGAGGRYLEIGAGSGNVLLSLVDLYDELIATELSSKRAESLEKLFSMVPNVKILHHNIEDDSLDFPNEHFDTIVMTAVIEHLIDPISVLNGLHRVLKVGGRLIIDTPNLAKWTRRLKLIFGYFPSTASIDEGLLCYDRKNPTDLYDEGHLHYFTFRSLGRLCQERAGFDHVMPFGYGKTILSRLWPTMFSDCFIVAYK